ncbi:MAG TPA: class I SAM-dependent methyltransferase [Thermoleophilaceae bacterium]|nr:class I SAM-dependent methyltransferase [Thermoleophilaceae bacterium]
MERVVTSNEEAIEAWDGVLFDRFVEFRDVLTTGLGVQGTAAMDLIQPRPGDRVLDIGCGFGDASQQLAERVGPEGSVHGVDASARFVETARREAADAGLGNVIFEVADVEATDFPAEFDLAFSRMGTMFFANPVAALRHVRAALVPGGRLCMVVWRQKIENDWMYRAEQAVESFVEEDEQSDEPTCGPGPFSMANADTTSGILTAAGFEQISLRRSDLPYRIGADLDAAVALALAIGPAGEVMRLAGDDAERLRPKIEAAVRGELAGLEAADGVMATSSTWIVTAVRPSGV